MSSYRILARGGVALLLLAVVVAAGAQVASIRLPHPAPRIAAVQRAHPWQLVQTTRSGPAGRSPIRVLVIGASLSHGLGASTPGHDYVSELRRMIAQRTGRPVSTTVWSRTGARIATSDRWTLPPGQQIVITQLITNDFFAGTPLLSYQSGATALLQRVRDTSPRASVLCLGAWEGAFSIDRMGVPVSAYNAIDQHACAVRHAAYLSLSPIFQIRACRGPKGRPTAFGRGDDFHPNDRGHQRLAAAILKQLVREHAVPAPGARPGSGTNSGVADQGKPTPAAQPG
ncbi:MAG: SGNH/GDSL hydrolase family protein [Candidatus Dormibacteraceae bacterium]